MNDKLGQTNNRKVLTRRGFVKSGLSALVTALITPSVAFANRSRFRFPRCDGSMLEDLDGFWIRETLTPSYNVRDNPLVPNKINGSCTSIFCGSGMKDEPDGRLWNEKYLSMGDPSVKIGGGFYTTDHFYEEAGRVFFEDEQGEKYFWRKTLTTNPAESQFWRGYIRRDFSSLYEGVKKSARTENDPKMTDAILRDIMKKVPLSYFQGEDKKITDKWELSKSLSHGQIWDVLQRYTWGCPYGDNLD
ncbi:hypothetical protein ACFL0X_02075 [Nanoarchaeota archaeon]